jgi:trehalose 6-phosphate phosphatase
VPPADATDAAVALLARRPEATALLVDFDGSLAPIVERPEDARPLPDALTQLARLARSLGRVGVVSGRPLDFLTRHVPVDGIVFAGIYGMERLVNGERMLDARVAPHLAAVAAALAELRTRLPAEVVESKSGVSVTLHWRPAPDRAAEIKAIGSEVAGRHGLATLDSRMAVELRPPIRVDKGDTTRSLVEGFGVGSFAGDDAGDLPAFAALERGVREGALAAAVRIGVLSAEAPPDLAASVDVAVAGPAGLVALLARVADEIA